MRKNVLPFPQNGDATHTDNPDLAPEHAFDLGPVWGSVTLFADHVIVRLDIPAGFHGRQAIEFRVELPPDPPSISRAAA